MNYKLLMKLEQEENEVLRKKIKRFELEINELKGQLVRAYNRVSDSETELGFVQDSLMHMNNRIVGYSNRGGSIIDVRC